MLISTRHADRLQASWQLRDPGIEASRRRQRWAALFGTLSFLFAAVAVGALIAHGLGHGSDARGCSEDGQPTHAVVSIIDQSDPFSSNQRALVKSELHRHVRDLGVGSLVTLHKLQRNEDGQPLTEMFNRCKPINGNAVNAMIDNPRLRERAYREQFAEPLQAALKSALVPGEANKSPLIEALQIIARRPVFDAGGQGRTLVLFSDGLQHTDLVSFFKRGYRYEELEQRNSVYLADLQERFSGMCVDMFVVSSKYPRQTAWPEFEAFWRNYWRAAGVNCLTFKRI